jgi:hypothetical protein
VPAMVNVGGLPYVIPDSMSPTGEESDDLFTRVRGRGVLGSGQQA